MNVRSPLVLAAALSASVSAAVAQDAEPPTAAEKPTLYVVGYAHLDTQWRWAYPQTIREFLAHTLHDNFALFEKHKDYVFNFTGARRYEMFREYYPQEFQQLKKYVAAGRWFPAGSSVDENDANTPSAESLIRNVLYGNRFFRKEFGVASDEYMLPDCFGFPASLPSILAHCGVKGFSTQKLTWGSIVGIPFNVGVWVGPDGHSVIAALNPGPYDSDIDENLATSQSWLKRIEEDGKKSGLYADFRYYGTGDVGGAPKEPSVEWLEKSLATDGPVKVVAGPANQLFDAIPPAQREKLPKYTGELELTEHSAGSATSEAAMKRWNRKNEFLANEAESCAALAAWLGARDYPAQRLEDAWTLVLGSQMHDIVSGTALAKGYDYAWNDEILAANQFEAVLTDSAEAVAAALDTSGDGQALVVFNPLAGERQDVVEAEIAGDPATARSAQVTGPDGAATPAQVLGAGEGSGTVRIAFLARAPSLGFAVFHAKLSADAPPADPSLAVAERRLENGRYVVTLDPNGDVASIQDKSTKQELLSAPARLELCYENPRNWPAWNMDWTDRQLPPREIVAGTKESPARFQVVERGPARVAVEVTRETAGSTFVQTIRLAAGDAGARVEFDTRIDWRTRERSLRAAFPLVAHNATATYDGQSGVVERGNMHAKQYEYGFQQWLDLTDAKGGFGVSVMSDCKYGSDKPDDGTLRLTLLHTPGTHGGYEDQATQDLGRHHVLYALTGHAGDWRDGKTPQEAARLNQPLIPFRATAHAGALGRRFSLFATGSDAVSIQAVKRAEDSDEWIVRLREHSGRPQKGLRLTAAVPIASAHEVDGQEREIGPARLENGALVGDVGGYELKAFALRLAPPPAKSPRPVAAPLTLAFDRDVVSTNANRADGFLPAEQLPRDLTAGDASFRLGPTGDGEKNALACDGQELALPAGAFDRLYLLTASDGDGVRAEFEVDGKKQSRELPAWTGFIGQWDHRIWRGTTQELAYGWSNDLAGIEPGFVRPGEVAWFASHHHTPQGDAFYEYSYLFKIALDLPPGAKSVRLPKDPHVLLLAATAVGGGPRIEPAAPLFDTLKDHVQDAPRVSPAAGEFSDTIDVAIEPGLYWRDGRVHYTLDGSPPGPSSPAYAGPFPLDHETTIQAVVLDDAGSPGPVAAARLAVHDTTPPRVVAVHPAFGSKRLKVTFSEPVSDSALTVSNYFVEPELDVASVRRGTGPRDVLLELSAAPAIGRPFKLTIESVADASPAHNAMKSASLDFEVSGPVFEQATIGADLMGKELRDVPNLPVKAGDTWTLNFFVKMAKQPDDRTLIAGFGRPRQAQEGGARYFAKFSRGIHFWSHDRDVVGDRPYDLNRWQMMTATYDGTTLRVYHDAQLLAKRDVALADDAAVVWFAPLDPWERQRRFDGELRGFTIWRDALSEEALHSLLAAAPAQ